MNVPVSRHTLSALRRGRPAEPSGRARILIVDDDERNLLAIRTVLEDIADVVLARSGEDALRQLLKGEFAVILLDVYMPGMDGYETAQIIRAREQTKRIPIIFLSAVNKETEHLIRGYSMGAVDYVFKPVEPVVLRSKAAVFVDLYMMTREVRRQARQEQELLDANLRANAERLRAEQELRLAEQRQAAIIQSLPLVLYLEDLEAAPRLPKFVSGNFAAVTGFTFEDVMATPTLWFDRLHPDDRERVTAALRARREGRGYAVEYRWQCADGTYKHFLDQAVLLRDAGGRPLEYAGTLLDVTERKDLETQLLHVRKMDALGQLTGGIAHDFNNLLAAVLGGLGLIERRVTLADDQRKVLEMTRHAAQQGAELVSRLLAFARKQKLEPARIDIANLSGTVSQLLAHTLGGLVALDWELEGDLWSPYADETQLELALMNLAINARDAMPEGGKICIACRNATLSPGGDAPAGDYVVLAVSDTGCGIPPEMLERVTEPFFTTKAVGKGTGLGLSMVYGFAQQSGGTMRIESRLDQGTTVELWLPRSPEALRRPPASTATSDPAERNRARHILLVDDHDGVRATTAAMLEDLGHRVTTATDGEHVCKLIQGEHLSAIDFIISDYAMPLVSGSEVIRKLRSVKPGLPGIIISGYADTAAISGAPEGVIVVAKPFTPAQLQDAIAAASHVNP
ncbi:response regulator [Frateuria terrea]|uniref:histidine kinase n=1 Tax=Frateuria terrea TaxID=529704 RepID=A0A1H6TLB6_9GAMM|nr:response regulator [Frateuria terrea]SEI80863.1 PAS domain S-box-containing protein [Frateuria terrea]SFP41605.1 PAS domain S-box-containing protein [Frateuria terrea]